MLFILEDNDDRIVVFRKALGTIPYKIMRAVSESIEWLKNNGHDVRAYSLDNDLYLPGYSGEPGEGWQLCSWITATMQKVPIIIHTSNSVAAGRMQSICTGAGWQYKRIIPVDGIEWIGLAPCG